MAFFGDFNGRCFVIPVVTIYNHNYNQGHMQTVIVKSFFFQIRVTALISLSSSCAYACSDIEGL